MSFLEKEETADKSSFWDWVVGIGLIVLIGGFTFFYQYQKRSSTSRFGEADSLFQAGNLKEAGRLYEELKSAEYHTTKDDSIVYIRLDSIATIQEQQNLVITQSKTRAAAGDTAGIAAELAAIPHKDLLTPEDSAWVDSAMGKSPMASRP